ncbi:unnamed protein product [Rotaria socialis]|uniref:Uncharacterized protein n=1 Tax=Rotaria socialis TaxID=392032 RepID=A0A820NRI2_9BILA|nr:unnamed protein product [Rotaria socialis]CAF4392727.1 unnamed protein product [Rotaria socialis]
MKVNILVMLIVLPMLASIGLYCFSFATKRWSRLDENLINRYHKNESQKRLQSEVKNNVKLELQNIRHAFRSHYGLFGYCLDYRWINLLTVKSPQDGSMRTPTLFCDRCNDSKRMCSETNCCMQRCDNKPDCPTYIDEINCDYSLEQTRYYWPKGNCIWQSTWIGSQDFPLHQSPYKSSPKHSHNYAKLIRYYVMFLLFVAAPLLTFLALLILFCINCVKRFYSIPFAFVSLFSLASFLSGAGALGIFLYEWIHDRFYRPDFTYELDQPEALVVALNPWLIEAEKLGLGFWLIVAAISATLFTTILSCCFCCGLQSEKSKLRFHVNNEVYEIVQMTPYDD